jgi:hypothetical protein
MMGCRTWLPRPLFFFLTAMRLAAAALVLSGIILLAATNLARAQDLRFVLKQAEDKETFGDSDFGNNADVHYMHINFTVTGTDQAMKAFSRAPSITHSLHVSSNRSPLAAAHMEP